MNFGNLLKNRLVKNVSWIFFGNIIHAVLSFTLNVSIARLLSLNDNGLLTYAASWIAFFTSVGTLGFQGIISREFSKNEERSNEYISSCIVARIIFSLISIIALQLIIYFSKSNDPKLNIIVLCQSMSILFGSFDMFVYWYRYKNKANITAIYRLIAFGISAVWRLVAIAVFHNLILYVIGVTVETFLFSLFLFLFYRKYYTRRILVKKQTIFDMLKMSYPFISSAVLASIYGQADKIMLKSMVDNSAVALYSAATTLAGVVVIIPMTLIEGFRPDIMDAKLSDETLYIKRLKQLYATVFWFCMAYGIFITVFAKYIMLFFYGKKYIGAVSSLSLVVWYTSFSYFGAINNVYMVAEDKVKWVQVCTFTGAFANIVMNYFLIPKMGIVGAALASLITQILANFIMMAIIPDLRKGFKIMINGIFLKGCLPSLKNIKRKENR